jgi:hypothetical protein
MAEGKRQLLQATAMVSANTIATCSALAVMLCCVCLAGRSSCFACVLVVHAYGLQPNSISHAFFCWLFRS